MVIVAEMMPMCYVTAASALLSKQYTWAHINISSNCRRAAQQQAQKDEIKTLKGNRIKASLWGFVSVFVVGFVFFLRTERPFLLAHWNCNLPLYSHMFYREPRNLYGAIDSAMIANYLVSFYGFKPVLDTYIVSREWFETAELFAQAFYPWRRVPAVGNYLWLNRFKNQRGIVW